MTVYSWVWIQTQARWLGGACAYLEAIVSALQESFKCCFHTSWLRARPHKPHTAWSGSSAPRVGKVNEKRHFTVITQHLVSYESEPGSNETSRTRASINDFVSWKMTKQLRFPAKYNQMPCTAGSPLLFLFFLKRPLF